MVRGQTGRDSGRWRVVAVAMMLALGVPAAGHEPDEAKGPAAKPGDKAPPKPVARPAAGPRLALVEGSNSARAPIPSQSLVAAQDANHATLDDQGPIAQALRLVADCRKKYQGISDYTCTFYKRERIDGRLSKTHIMNMKARSKPNSIYLRFEQPAAGREAIYIEGQHKGKVLAHDVGLGRLIAGTLHLDPGGAQAMEDCRHPITEAGIGRLIDTVWNRWSTELTPEESLVTLRDDMMIGDRKCTLIETTHPKRRHHLTFHRVRLFIDQELGLPIRFEGYDWPKTPGADPELTEEYTYTNVRVNIGLGDRDFDAANPAYAFGRF